MSYKDKFHESQEDAVNSMIAKKMLSILDDQRGKIGNGNAINLSRRWIWELIQNAKDASEDRVTIQVKYTEYEEVTFLHTGDPFSTSNLRFLIEQISDKDRKRIEGQRRKKTGKFGTGFLTTHLLSEKVTVQGVISEPEHDPKFFSIELDRSGTELEDITDAVSRAKEIFNSLDSIDKYDYKDGDYNTSFTYPIEDSVSNNVANAGVLDLLNGGKYAMLFVPEIQEIIIPSEDKVFTNRNPIQLEDNVLRICDIQVNNLNRTEPRVSKYAVLCSGFTSIAVPIRQKDGVTTILSVSDRTPRLFCDFPLVGTENFPFPVIINNPNFNPTDPRDGVFLTTTIRENQKIDENKSIIKSAVELFLNLLQYASDNNWQNLHELAKIKEYVTVPDWVDKKWLMDNVISRIRQKIIEVPIVKAADGSLRPISEKGNKVVWFPTASKKEMREAIWESAKDWFPHKLPALDQVEIWNSIVWSECGKLTLDKFAELLMLENHIDSIDLVIKGDVWEWLNNFFNLLFLDEKEPAGYFRKYAILPNQNGNFKVDSDLKQQISNIDDEFKDILELLGNNVRESFLDTRITSVSLPSASKKDEGYFIREINTEVTEKANNRSIAKSYSESFQKLLGWFRRNPTKAQEYFPVIYENMHLLYDDEKVMENMSKAEELDAIMEEFKIEDLKKLRTLLAIKGKGDLLPVTQEIIASMGINSVDEWKEAIKDKNLAELYSHESTPTTDMFAFAQSHITRAKAAILAHLETLPGYDLTEVEETANTLLAGVLKDNQSITIVTRPAYNGEVIIYYGSEKDILDFEPSELWVDDGKMPKRITLGHILKSSGIVKFPI